jgi:ribosomal protein S18 acetylase RimI-like enzyme
MAMQEPWIRPRTDADIPSCATLLRQVHALDGYPVEGVDDADGWMQPEGLMAAWVAGEAGDVLGHAAICEPHGDAAVSMLVARTGVAESEVAVLARLFVGPAARGRGLGKMLAQTAFDYASLKRRKAVFDVMEKDHAAISMYERMGCVLLGRTSYEVSTNHAVHVCCYAAPRVIDPAA